MIHRTRRVAGLATVAALAAPPALAADPVADSRYAIAGTFPDDERAVGTLRVTVTIRDRSGARVDSCTARRTVRWSADRLGVAPEPIP